MWLFQYLSVFHLSAQAVLNSLIMINNGLYDTGLNTSREKQFSDIKIIRLVLNISDVYNYGDFAMLTVL